MASPMIDACRSSGRHTEEKSTLTVYVVSFFSPKTPTAVVLLKLGTIGADLTGALDVSAGCLETCLRSGREVMPPAKWGYSSRVLSIRFVGDRKTTVSSLLNTSSRVTESQP